MTKKNLLLIICKHSCFFWCFTKAQGKNVLLLKSAHECCHQKRNTILESTIIQAKYLNILAALVYTLWKELVILVTATYSLTQKLHFEKWIKGFGWVTPFFRLTIVFCYITFFYIFRAKDFKSVARNVSKQLKKNLMSTLPDWRYCFWTVSWFSPWANKTARGDSELMLATYHCHQWELPLHKWQLESRWAQN